MTPDVQPTADGGEDIVVTDKELFDQAIAPEPTPPDATPAAPPQGQAPLQAPMPPSDPLAAAMARQRDAQGRFIPVQGPRPPQADHRVPLREILDEREKRQKAEAETQQLRAAWQQLEQQAAAMQRQQQQQQQPKTIFDGPDEYLTNNVINPLLQMAEVRFTQQKDGFSRQMAR